MSDESTNPDDDLRSRLHAMETKIRRMRDNRNGHNENARRAADSRNAVQEQAKGLREAIDELKAKQKEIRDEARIHSDRLSARRKACQVNYGLVDLACFASS